MKFFEKLRQRLFRGSYALSQHLVCPHCDTQHDAQENFAKFRCTFEEIPGNAHEYLYMCGECRAVSRWYVENKPKLMCIESYGVSIDLVRQEIFEHFKSWTLGCNTANGRLAWAAEKLTENMESLESYESWKHHDNGQIYFQGIAVDFIIYALLASDDAEICYVFNRIAMSDSTQAIETYLGSTLHTTEADLIEEAYSHNLLLFDAHKAAMDVPYLFVKPAVENHVAALLRIGIMLLQIHGVQRFHTRVAERLHHYVNQTY